MELNLSVRAEGDIIAIAEHGIAVRTYTGQTISFGPVQYVGFDC